MDPCQLQETSSSGDSCSHFTHPEWLSTKRSQGPMRLLSIKETSRLFEDARYRSVGVAVGLAVGPVISSFLRGNEFSCALDVLKRSHLLRPWNRRRLCSAAPPKANIRTEIKTPQARIGEKL